jgi:L-amino acid N-acyltransferase YncA
LASQIRLAQPVDAEAIAAIYRPFVTGTVISFEVSAPDREEMARRIVGVTASYPWLVCEVGGQVAGYAYATRHRERAAYRWSVDTSVYVSQTHWRSGIGRGLYVSLFRILAAQGYFNAYAGITLPNPASVALHEAVGFKPVGTYQRAGHKFGAWHDVAWWQMALREHEAAPAEPLDLANVRGRPAWESLLASGQALIKI